MEPINHLERKKTIGGFAALYLGAAALVAVIFFTVGHSFSPVKKIVEKSAPAPDEKLLQLIKNQQAEITRLQQPTKAKTDTGQQKGLNLKTELQQKDEYIAVLEEELKMWQDDKAYTANEAINTLKKGSETLKLLVTAKENEVNSLKNVNESLDKENKSLTTQLASQRTGGTVSNDAIDAIKTRYATLERKFQQLNADLGFAKIDCNLTRADANQIISNSKQRKELLSEALSMLNDLSKSNDDGIQKRANDKISQLSQIVGTIRD